MRLSPWQIFGPLAIAVLLFAGVALHQAASEATPSCGDADTSLHEYLNKQAQKLYTDILEEHPDSDCAATGMKRLVKRLCLRARALDQAGAAEQADKTYASLLDMDPPGRAVTCAKRGLSDTAKGGGGGGEECPCLQVCPGKGSEVDNPEPQDAEIDDPEPKDSEIDDPEPRDSEIDDPEPQDDEIDDPEPRNANPKPCPWSG